MILTRLCNTFLNGFIITLLDVERYNPNCVAREITFEKGLCMFLFEFL